MRTPLRFLFVVAIVVACVPTEPSGSSRSGKPTPSPTVEADTALPTPEPQPVIAAGTDETATESAIVFGPQGVALVEIESGNARPIFGEPVHACLSDPAAGAVWWLADAGGLWAYDLRQADQARRIIGNVPDRVDAIGITTWKGGKIASASDTDFELGIQLDLRSTPRAFRMIGCMSDVFDCFADPSQSTLRPELETRATAIDGLRLEDPGTAKRLGDRAAGVIAPARPQVAPKVAVAVDRCRADPDSCGSAIALPNTALQIVVVANESGDLYHELVALYDPQSREFMPLTDPKTRSTTPPQQVVELSRLWVAPSGQAYAFDENVVHLQRGPLHSGARACGFTNGGELVLGLAT